REREPQRQDEQDETGKSGHHRGFDLAIHPADDDGSRPVGDPGEQRRGGGEQQEAENQSNHDFPGELVSTRITADETSSIATSAVSRALALSRHSTIGAGSSVSRSSRRPTAAARCPALASAALLAQTSFQSSSPSVRT